MRRRSSSPTGRFVGRYELAKLLDRHRAASFRLRGIRHSAAWDSDPQLSFPTLAQDATQGMLTDADFIDGVRELGVASWSTMPVCCTHSCKTSRVLADEAPDTRIVVKHIGMPLAMGRAGASFANHVAPRAPVRIMIEPFSERLALARRSLTVLRQRPWDQSADLW